MKVLRRSDRSAMVGDGYGDRKLVAAEPSSNLSLPHEAVCRRCKCRQHLIACSMAMLIVDALEPSKSM